MVSLRRRKLLGLCSGKNAFLAPQPKNSENGTVPENLNHNVRSSVRPIPSHDVNRAQGRVISNGFAPSSASGSSTTEAQNIEPKEESFQTFSGLPVKRRKRHRRKQVENQEPCLMRGVYFKNMKWQAAIKVDKKQIHLGTVSSQEEAARLYDRAAFMCGREPNFELSEEEKQELRKFKWEEFLAYTRRSITNKKFKRRIGAGSRKTTAESPMGNSEGDNKQEMSKFSTSEEAEMEADSSAE